MKTECLKRSRNSLKADDILVLPYDISNFDENATAFQKIIDTYGQIDVLVANAARVYASATADNDFAHIRQLFDINYLAHVNITQLGKCLARLLSVLFRPRTLSGDQP